MVGKVVQIGLAAGLCFIVYTSLSTLLGLWASAPAEVPQWATMVSKIFPGVLFLFLALTIYRI